MLLWQYLPIPMLMWNLNDLDHLAKLSWHHNSWSPYQWSRSAVMTSLASILSLLKKVRNNAVTMWHVLPDYRRWPVWKYDTLELLFHTTTHCCVVLLDSAPLDVPARRQCAAWVRNSHMMGIADRCGFCCRSNYLAAAVICVAALPFLGC